MLRATPHALVALALVACGAPSFDEAKSSLTRADATAPQRADAFVDANAAFAVDLLHRTADPNANALTSPHSISLALAMTYAGAGGTTKANMKQALHFDLPDAELHAAFNWVDREIASRAHEARGEGGRPAKVSVQNTIFGQKDLAFETPFLDVLATDYGAGVKLADFATDPGGASSKINDWVASQTEDRIQNLLEPDVIDSLTRVVLVNTVYVSAPWLTPFTDTANAPFHTDGQSPEVPMMHVHYGAFRYAANEAAEVVELPLDADGLAFAVVLPTGDLASYETTLDGASLQALLRQAVPDTVDLTLPKLKLEPAGSVSLRSALGALGMADAFEDGADFSGVTKSAHLYLKDVVHQAYLAIDEDGLEAAAATAVVEEDDSAPSEPTHQVKVDRPFLVVLRDTRTAEILFLGHVVDPR